MFVLIKCTKNHDIVLYDFDYLQHKNDKEQSITFLI